MRRWAYEDRQVIKSRSSPTLGQTGQNPDDLWQPFVPKVSGVFDLDGKGLQQSDKDCQTLGSNMFSLTIALHGVYRDWCFEHILISIDMYMMVCTKMAIPLPHRITWISYSVSVVL